MLLDANLDSLGLNREDVQRVAEFFDCDVDAAFEFVRMVWLPDAGRTALRLAQAVKAREWTSVLYLCDKLREGARCVGATRIMQYAAEMEDAALDRRWLALSTHVTDLRAALDTLARVIVRRNAAATSSPISGTQ